MKKNSKSKDSSPTSAGPDFLGFMAKVQEQLLALGRKMDSLITRLSVGEDLSKPVQRPEQPQQSSRPQETPQLGQGNHHPQGHRERILHKAVCADCKKDCEVPFKPSGDRPVYCKECFAQRKAAYHPKGNPVPQKAPEPQRHVTVTKKGVGKVTVSEVIAPAQRNPTPKKKPSRPPKRSKK
ncbi:MAG TPA: hypothetical protein PLL75_00315 [Candidatus Omnitrophota bacterium]|nr:hypothetical protein [Candidatus Omnitrophota bacterium]HPS36160.1 hypothetical protein [Candidatus Omnitrophota bacterium]